MVFSEYAKFYDLYYANKDYSEEVDYILSLAKRRGKDPKTLLDMGCGTGKHLFEFAQKGIQCDGFDLSEEMLEHAKKRLTGFSTDLMLGDLTTFRNGKKYDLVVSMFAAMGYLITNEQLVAGFITAKQHLKSDGLFIFDGWFGPAVLAQKPDERCHIYHDGVQKITRKAVPILDPCSQSVSINYTVSLYEQDTEIKRINEEHTMRFFFVQETALALELAGLRLFHYCPFLKPDKKMTAETWNISFIAGLAQ